MKFLQSRLAGIFWLFCSFCSGFVFLMNFWVMSDRVSNPFLFPYVNGLWGMIAILYMFVGFMLLFQTKKEREENPKAGKRIALVAVYAFLLQLISAPAIPWV